MNSLDRSLFLWLNLERGGAHVWVDIALFASKWLPVIALAVLLAALVRGPRRHRRALLTACGAMLLAWAGSHAMKDLVAVPRPYLLGLGTDWLGRAGAGSFPSTHASVALAMAAACWLNPWPLAVRVALGVTGLVISWSRIALGVHFPSDVAGAAVLAVVSALVVHRAAARLMRPRVAAETA